MARRDRYGDEIEDNDEDVDQADPVDEPDPHPADCDAWLGEDAAGRVVPCPVCRPHLAEQRRHLARLLHGPRSYPCTPRKAPVMTTPLEGLPPVTATACCPDCHVALTRRPRLGRDARCDGCHAAVGQHRQPRDQRRADIDLAVNCSRV
jgi:hypothetical protein